LSSYGTGRVDSDGDVVLGYSHFVFLLVVVAMKKSITVELTRRRESKSPFAASS
jgi:hypothetical protein